MQYISPIWQFSKEQFQQIIDESSSIKQVLNRVGIPSTGNNYCTIKRRCAHDNIDLQPLLKRARRCGISTLRKHTNKITIPTEKLLVEHSSCARHAIKKRLLSENLLENKCAICNLQYIWNNKPIVLVLDHINGIPDDYRIENLRLLCPNCNSQEPTFARGVHGNKSITLRTPKSPILCTLCQKQITKRSKSGLCLQCSLQVNIRKNKIQGFIKPSMRPSKERLQTVLLSTMSYVQTGKYFGVSNVTARKWAIFYGIQK